MVKMTVNGEAVEYRLDPQTPLLWALRDASNLTGTKYGCDSHDCGACTVIVDGRAVTSCSQPLASLEGARVTTIEGLSADGSHPIQQAWVAEQVTMCGYCEPGFIMAIAALLQASPPPRRMQSRGCRTSAVAALTHASAKPLRGLRPRWRTLRPNMNKWRNHNSAALHLPSRKTLHDDLVCFRRGMVMSKLLFGLLLAGAAAPALAAGGPHDRHHNDDNNSSQQQELRSERPARNNEQARPQSDRPARADYQRPQFNGGERGQFNGQRPSSMVSVRNGMAANARS